MKQQDQLPEGLAALDHHLPGVRMVTGGLVDEVAEVRQGHPCLGKDLVEDLKVLVRKFLLRGGEEEQRRHPGEAAERDADDLCDEGHLLRGGHPLLRGRKVPVGEAKPPRRTLDSVADAQADGIAHPIAEARRGHGTQAEDRAELCVNEVAADDHDAVICHTETEEWHCHECGERQQLFGGRRLRHRQVAAADLSWRLPHLPVALQSVDELHVEELVKGGLQRLHLLRMDD
mmetsp:Transcript_16647/g.48293  ORF Transcript_16647/g.48293 Transcript_16647/m.48293 type:complete len:231 (-) Transcript_16647:637-1329(-)